MHGICFDYPLKDWFDFKIPNTTIEVDFIEKCLDKHEFQAIKPSSKLVWIGGNPIISKFSKTRKGNVVNMQKLTFHQKACTYEIELEQTKAVWLITLLKEITPAQAKETKNISDLKADFELKFEDFESFWHSKQIDLLRQDSLLVL